MQDGYNKDLYRNSNKADALAVSLAFVGTILIHVGAFYAIPNQFASFKTDENKNDELQIEILPPKFERKLPEFIEANPFGNNQKPLSPDAPESYKDQRAADEIPDPNSKSKKPFVEGEIKDGKKIVSGTMDEENRISPAEVLETLERPLEQPAQPTELAQPSPPAPAQQPQEHPQQSNEAEAKKQSSDKEESTGEKSETKESKSDDNANTTPKKSDEDTAKTSEDGFIKVEKKSDKISSDAKESDAISKKEKRANTPQQKSDAKIGNKGESKDDKIKGEDDNRQTSSDTRAPQEKTPPPQPEETPKENLPAPRPRPTLSMKIPAGPLADNPSRASTRGVVSCDSRFSEFGAYQQRMIEAISRQWNLIGSKYDLGPAVGSFVVIEFYLNSMGELSKFQIIHTTSTNTGTGLCEQSILTTAPYGEWTQEMVNTFGGQDQSVRITFHYR